MVGEEYSRILTLEIQKAHISLKRGAQDLGEESLGKEGSDCRHLRQFGPAKKRAWLWRLSTIEHIVRIECNGTMHCTNQRNALFKTCSTMLKKFS